MTIEILKEKLNAMYPQYQEEADNTDGDEEMYAQGQLAMLDMILDMLEETDCSKNVERRWVFRRGN